MSMKTFEDYLSCDLLLGRRARGRWIVVHVRLCEKQNTRLLITNIITSNEVSPGKWHIRDTARSAGQTTGQLTLHTGRSAKRTI